MYITTGYDLAVVALLRPFVLIIDWNNLNNNISTKYIDTRLKPLMRYALLLALFDLTVVLFDINL